MYIMHNVIFYKKTPSLYQGFKSENLCFFNFTQSRSENTGPLTRGHVKSSQMRNETPLQL